VDFEMRSDNDAPNTGEVIERRSDVPGSDETILHIRAEVMKNMPVQEETEEMRKERIKHSTRKTFANAITDLI
jgi:hypothetical protein